jgi:hypothetical protein
VGRDDGRWVLLQRGEGRRREGGTGERVGGDGEAVLAHLWWKGDVTCGVRGREVIVAEECLSMSDGEGEELGVVRRAGHVLGEGGRCIGSEGIGSSFGQGGEGGNGGICRGGYRQM